MYARQVTIVFVVIALLLLVVHLAGVAILKQSVWQKSTHTKNAFTWGLPLGALVGVAIGAVTLGLNIRNYPRDNCLRNYNDDDSDDDSDYEEEHEHRERRQSRLPRRPSRGDYQPRSDPMDHPKPDELSPAQKDLNPQHS